MKIKSKKVDNNNSKKVDKKIDSILLVLNLIKNNFEFEKNEMTNSEIKQWVLANDLINKLLIKLAKQKNKLLTKLVNQKNGGK